MEPSDLATRHRAVLFTVRLWQEDWEPGRTMNPNVIKSAKNRAYQFVETHQQAMDEGRISEAERFAIYNEFFHRYLSRSQRSPRPIGAWQ
jgi:hypothetical protein